MTDEKNRGRETGTTLNPRYDSNGLVTAVITDDSSGDVLMVAFMNAEALAQTLETNMVHFFSRSRQKLWKKGETSGNILELSEIRIDCDQDALWIKARPAGPTCHTGAPSCFYRKVINGALESIE
ncbi:Phosphoribosyl-AMP cyclohydrolase [hydrothermal vent metagenome]|uniref:Histidine biosynthesis bifunctional protein HisIE n=1 Tax=hydrothermal vent metagenome TaxID=652676 RepID=A0A3B0RW87_9ZZZZ